MVESLRNYKEAIPIVKEYEAIVRKQKKSILNVAYRLGCVFRRFKKSDKFMEMVKELGVSKSVGYFKIKFSVSTQSKKDSCSH